MITGQLSPDGQWYPVHTPEGDDGWAYADYLSEQQPADAQTTASTGQETGGASTGETGGTAA
jgi:hypothetical protein